MENFGLISIFLQWFEVLEGLLGPYWKAIGLAFNCTFLLFGSVIQLIACARYEIPSVVVKVLNCSYCGNHDFVVILNIMENYEQMSLML